MNQMATAAEAMVAKVNAAFGQIRQPAAEPQQRQRQQRQAGKWANLARRVADQSRS